MGTGKEDNPEERLTRRELSRLRPKAGRSSLRLSITQNQAPCHLPLAALRRQAKPSPKRAKARNAPKAYDSKPIPPYQKQICIRGHDGLKRLASVNPVCLTFPKIIPGKLFLGASILRSSGDNFSGASSE